MVWLPDIRLRNTCNLIASFFFFLHVNFLFWLKYFFIILILSSVTFVNRELSVKPALVFKSSTVLTERLYAFSLSLSLHLQVTRIHCNRSKRNVPQKRPQESQLLVQCNHCSRLYPLLIFTALTINTLRMIFL